MGTVADLADSLPRDSEDVSEFGEVLPMRLGAQCEEIPLGEYLPYTLDESLAEVLSDDESSAELDSSSRQ